MGHASLRKRTRARYGVVRALRTIMSTFLVCTILLGNVSVATASLPTYSVLYGGDGNEDDAHRFSYLHLQIPKH